APSEAHTRFPLTGDQPLSLAEAMNLMGTLQEMDELEHQLNQARRTNDIGSINSVDPEQMRELVGDEEAEALRDIQNMVRQLEEEGLVKRSGSDYELTARGIRRIGQKMLEDIFDQLDKDAFGQHRLPEHGYGGERTDDTKPYVFGDAFHLQLERTVMNGIVRNGPGTPIQLLPDDFEVYRTEQMTQSATVVMLDMSYSMQLNDLWQPAKKVAIALESMIRGQFPRDQLYIVGFAYLARQYQPEELINLTEWDYAQGTNMIFGLRTARRLLAASRAVNKQIIMVTDGGPTVIEEGEDWFFTWPDTSLAELQTLREVRRCARDNISINVFMLSDDTYLKHFVNQMATVNKGRAMYSSPDHLGEYIMIDYLSNRRKHVT
ncbi:MAG: vWA domain-containing protein, partial [Ktedonobacterales bacterium]